MNGHLKEGTPPPRIPPFVYVLFYILRVEARLRYSFVGAKKAAEKAIPRDHAKLLDSSCITVTTSAPLFNGMMATFAKIVTTARSAHALHAVVAILVLHAQLAQSVGNMRTNRPNPRTNSLGLRSEDLVTLKDILDVDYLSTEETPPSDHRPYHRQGEVAVVVFQVPEDLSSIQTAEERTEPSKSPKSPKSPKSFEPSTGGGRARSPTRQHEEAGPRPSTRIRTHASFMEEVRQRDPGESLFFQYGFLYLGRVSLQLPDFHVIMRISSQENDTLDQAYEEHLRDVFGATWISPQTKRPRSLRQPTVTTRTYAGDAKRAARKARVMARKRAAQQQRAEMEELGRNIRQSALRRNALLMIHPDGPLGRTLTSSWSSRRLQAIQNDVRQSYAKDHVPSDPLVKDQWFLHGGEYEDAHRRFRAIPVPGAVFLDVMSLWKNPVRTDGRGVVIAVVDDGVNFVHSDLRDKFVPVLSADLAEPVHVSPDVPEEERRAIIQNMHEQTKHGLPLVGQAHGTSVASVAAGSPSDGTCGVGVAPGAMLSSIRLFGMGEPGTGGTGSGHRITELQEALGLSHRCVHMDAGTGEQKVENMVYVVSWGPEDSSDNQTPVPVSPIVEAAIQGCVEHGRRGFGSIYVVAAGNGKQWLDSVDLDGYASLRYTIAVGAISRTGYPVNYAEGGESLLVVVPSSDHKRGITAATTMGSFFDSRMKTLAQHEKTTRGEFTENTENTEFKGFTGRANDKENAVTGLSAGGCTSAFGGTSASASMVAGVVAMMLQANPQLTWKDVQDILIRSCSKPHYGEALRDAVSPLDPHVLYREVVPVRLAQNRDDQLFLRGLQREKEPQADQPVSSPEHEEAEAHGIQMLNLIKSSLYVFYAPLDQVEWLENQETGLHHSRMMGFGIPDVPFAISLSKRRGSGGEDRSIQNDYAVRSHNLVHNMVDYDFAALDSNEARFAAKEDAFLQQAKQGNYYREDGAVPHQEITAWHVVLDDRRHPVHQIYHEGNGADRSSFVDTRYSENFVVEVVELYVNATVPTAIGNSQLALCDRTALCSLFLPGMPYAKTTVEEQQLEYTFTTPKHWGQRNPYDGGWVVMMRNIYPVRSAALNVHELVLTVYGHYE